MTMQNQKHLKTIILGVSVSLLLIGGYVVLRPFFSGIAWAIVISLATWPLFEKISRALPRWLASTAMVGVVALTSALIIAPIVFTLFREVLVLSSEIRAQLPQLRDQLREASLGHPLLADLLRSLQAKILSPGLEQLEKALEVASEYQRTLFVFVTSAIGGFLGLIAQSGVALFTMFFLFYHGESIAKEFNSFVHTMFGESADNILVSMRETIRGAVYGVLATSVAQGILAGLGFLVAGAPMPILLGVAATLFSLIPMGTPFVYVPVVIFLGLTSSWITAVLLLLWCVLIVSTIDNLIRPIFISSATNVSMALVFFGVLGGVIGFGLIGIFVGPVILVILQVLFRQVIREKYLAH